MNTLVIMQPTYLPWVGFFHLIANADKFVFLDDVKIEKQSWQVRNRLLHNGEPHYISVSINGSRNQTIKDVLLNDSTLWRKKHSQLLQHTYKKHPFGEDVLDNILPIINDKNITSLAVLNEKLIINICQKLDINTQFFKASSLKSEGTRTEKLVNLCRELQCDHYLSPLGSKEYITQDGNFSKSDISLTYQDFIPMNYPQKGINQFIPYLSIIDMIANIGWNESARKLNSY